MAATPVLHDLDGDRDLDVVVVSGPCCGREVCEKSGHVTVLLNDGRGRLTKAGERIRLGGTALGAAVEDINHDSIPDIVAFHHQSYNAAVLIGLGGGRFEDPEFVVMHQGERPHVHGLAIADVNNDGHPDFVATLVDDHAIAVMLGDGSGRFSPATGQPFFAHRQPYAALQLTDIDNDGTLDAIMTDVRGGALTVLVGSGTGMFSPRNGFRLTRASPLKSVERPMSCDLGDLDGDGDLDAIVFTDESEKAVRLVNIGGGIFEEPDDALIRLGAPATGGVLVDLDLDGNLDLVSGAILDDTVRVKRGLGNGRFARSAAFHTGGMTPRVAVGDMNGDGLPDIVSGNYDGDGSVDRSTGQTASGTLSVLINRARPSD